MKCLGVFGRFFHFSKFPWYHFASIFGSKNSGKSPMILLWEQHQTSEISKASLPRLLSEREALAVLGTIESISGCFTRLQILHLSPWIIHECTERNTITHPSKHMLVNIGCCVNISPHPDLIISNWCWSNMDLLVTPNGASLLSSQHNYWTMSLLPHESKCGDIF